MRSNLAESLRHVLVHEGGYVNHPQDPGGPTNKGITQAVYDSFRQRKKLPPKSVRGISMEEVAEIYERQYWAPVRADDMPTGLDYAVFDFAVNSGTSRAAKSLQKVLGVKIDGVIGERTLAAIAQRETIELVEAYVAERMRFLQSLKPRNGKGGWKAFGKGWTRRVMGEHAGTQMDDIGVIDRAIKMINKEEVPLPVAAAPGKSTVEDRDSPAESSINQSAVVDIVTKVGAGAAIIPNLDGTAQILIGVAFIVMIGLSIVIFRDRIRAWADGWR